MMLFLIHDQNFLVYLKSKRLRLRFFFTEESRWYPIDIDNFLCFCWLKKKNKIKLTPENLWKESNRLRICLCLLANLFLHAYLIFTPPHNYY